MKKLINLLLFLISISSFSQQKSTCDTWKNEEGKIVDFDKKIDFCKKTISKVDLKCKIEIFTSIANTYSYNYKIDSATSYFDKAINLC